MGVYPPADAAAHPFNIEFIGAHIWRNQVNDDTLRLYQSSGSPNSRRVRIFLAEKGLEIPLIPVDLGKGEQHTEAYRAISPRRVVPTLVIEDGTAIGEVPVILRYLEEIHPQTPLHGETAKERALVTMWERRVEQEGFASVMEAIRNTAMVTVDFAAKAINFAVPEEHAALKRWYDQLSRRPSATA
jgi:glutathione S-transferase